MNVVGEMMTILSSQNLSLAGKTGKVVLDTSHTLVLAIGATNVRVPKVGTTFRMEKSGRKLEGSEIFGRLEDRLGKSI